MPYDLLVKNDGLQNQNVLRFADVDCDTDVDVAEFAAFQNAFNGSP